MLDPRIRLTRPKTSTTLILAVDFDGVIHNPADRYPGKRLGSPFPDAQEAMQQLYDAGHTLIIFTTKAQTDAGKEAVQKWLDFFNIPHAAVTSTKPNADYYIDDKAINHTSWPSTFAKIGFSPEAD